MRTREQRTNLLHPKSVQDTEMASNFIFQITSICVYGGTTTQENWNESLQKDQN